MSIIMKNTSYIMSLALASAALLATSSCSRDEFAEMNIDKTAVVKAEPTQILSQAILEFQANPYMLWFNNTPTFYGVSQMAVPSGSFTDDVARGANRQGFQSIEVLKYVNALKNLRSTMSADESAKYDDVAAALDVLSVYLGIFDTDDCGDAPFTEAANARYGGTLTPKYDHVADLYDLFLKMLDESIATFTDKNDKDISFGNADPIFNGDVAKWAKLANSIKLKLAARLIHQDFDRAKAIAKEALGAPCGLILASDDDFLFHKADKQVEGNSQYDKGDFCYNTTNTTLSYNGTSAAKKVADFLIDNQDPRVRFLYTKNQWNSKIVNWFLEAGRKSDIPSFILANVETEVDAEGKEHFKAWKGLGEPWVRYYGLPDGYNAKTDEKCYEYFRYSTNKAASADGKTEKTYRPFSQYNEELVQGRVDFTLPTCPDDGVYQDTEDNPWYGMYLTSAEVNLYLAEFAVYEGNTTKANDYLHAAVEASVKVYDRLASLNKVPYYFNEKQPGIYAYDPEEKSIQLRDGEIDVLLAQPAYNLSGNKAEDLEKIFIQQLIHFSYMPKDLFVTARRSGVPKIGSSLLPRTVYSEVPVDQFARRTVISEPTSTDLMRDILLNAYTYQGFTWDLAPTTTNAQRVWQDKGAPQYGEGPNKF